MKNKPSDQVFGLCGTLHEAAIEACKFGDPDLVHYLVSVRRRLERDARMIQERLENRAKPV